MGIIWALARNTIIQAFRMRAAMVLIVLFFIAAPLLLFNVGDDNAEDGRTQRLIHIEADGTQEGEVKLLLSYSITIASMLLMVLTILLSASVLDVEIVKKYAFLICSKPVQRWQIMVGKWLGIVLLNAGLLFIMGFLILGAVWYFARTDPVFPAGRQHLMDSVLSSQVSIKPDTLNLEDEYNKLRLELMKEGATEDIINKQIQRPVVKEYFEECTVRINPYGIMAFRLKNVPIAENPEGKHYTIRYKLYSEKSDNRLLTVRWRFSRKSPDTYVEIIETQSRDSELKQFKIPAMVVDDNGEVLIEIQNMSIGDPSATDRRKRQSFPVTLSMIKGLELLAPTESSLGNILYSISNTGVIKDLADSMPFIMNFFRALILLLIRLSMLAAIGVAATSILHFPVAMLVLLLVVFLASSRDVYSSILKSTIRREEPAAATESKPDENIDVVVFETLDKIGNTIWKYTLYVVTQVPPRFADTDPVPDFAVGREIGIARIMAQCFWDLILRGGTIFAFGIFLFYRREIGRPEI